MPRCDRPKEKRKESKYLLQFLFPVLLHVFTSTIVIYDTQNITKTHFSYIPMKFNWTVYFRQLNAAFKFLSFIYFSLSNMSIVVCVSNFLCDRNSPVLLSFSCAVGLRFVYATCHLITEQYTCESSLQFSICFVLFVSSILTYRMVSYLKLKM